MDLRKTEKFILLIISLAGMLLTLESLLMGWEFWVPPLIIIGTAFMWFINITNMAESKQRKAAYVIYAMLAAFYHGVHETSFFDVSVVMAMIMVTYALLMHIFIMNLFLGEYVVIMIIQLLLAYRSETFVFDPLSISRVFLHVIVILFIYMCSIWSIRERNDAVKEGIKKDEIIESYDADMEDFLSNISHEFRTPVNVVNGMSDLLIKRSAGSEAYSIKDAGMRLAYQIEDIQDYTECKRNKVILEEDDYISTSLINDVVTSFRLVNQNEGLELVVDMAPSVPMKMHGDIRKIHKIFRHLLENAVKFTRQGGILVKMYTENTGYGVNLCIEMTDTGIGMGRKAIQAVSEGMYQVNKKRNRSSGGIGLGLYIVHGFTHRMGGFVNIESDKGKGTTVIVTIPQKVSDASPCLMLNATFTGNILFHVRSDKYRVPAVRDFYRSMAANLAAGIKVPLYSAETIKDIERLMEKLNVTYIFMGQEEYEDNPEYFDRLSMGNVVIAVSAYTGFRPNPGSRVMAMPKPLYAYPVIRILNDGLMAGNLELGSSVEKPVFKDVRALIVDDEPMNLVVATGLFADYGIMSDTAGSGREAIDKFKSNEYDIVFMDHMMPEMDGVEAMHHIRKAASERGREIPVVALTANAISGAKEMFMKEGFDGFIAKPIDTDTFERVMKRLLPADRVLVI